MSLTLYYHPLASYCWKVLIALQENGTEFDGQIIDLGNPEHRSELQAVWPMTKFPAIRDRQRGIDLAESSIVIEYLDRFYPGRTKFIPEDWGEALEVRLWDRVFDNYVHTPMQEIVSDRIRNASGDMAPAYRTLAAAYAMIDRQLGGWEWAVGDAFSMADCAAAPALFYASTLQPFPDGCSRLAAYFERLVERSSVKRTLEQAQPYFHMYPFTDAIPVRFLGRQSVKPESVA